MVVNSIHDIVYIITCRHTAELQVEHKRLSEAHEELKERLSKYVHSVACHDRFSTQLRYFIQ